METDGQDGARRMSMQEYKLPDEIRGEWIWLRSCLGSLESYVLFRKDFTLFETPATADFWITARTTFHVFLNGRYLAFGPPACPTEDAYVTYMDVSFLCETGKNSIAILAHNTSVSRFGARRQRSGLWAQLNINSSPHIWTDESWLCKEADAYAANRPRVSSAAGFTEEVDLRRLPMNWDDRDFDASAWVSPDFCLSLGRGPGKILPTTSPSWELAIDHARTLSCEGVWRPNSPLTFFSFAKLVPERGGGVYAALSYVYAKDDESVAADIYCDDPFVFFVNDELNKSQGVSVLPAQADLDLCRPPCFRQGEMTDTRTEIALRKGWNKLMLAQQVEPGSAGVFFVLPGVETHRLKFVRRLGETSLVGWSLVGPLRTPIQLLTGNVDLEDLPKASYVPSEEERVDESAYLDSCAFDPTVSVPLPADEVELGTYGYAVWDLGSTVYGCPQIRFDGMDGDIVDIVSSEHYVGGQTLPMMETRRNVDTVILSGGECTWRACGPRGFRYIMVVVRYAAGDMRVWDCGVARVVFTFDNKGTFESSDDRFNAIWRAGERTLSATLQGHFLDSPTKDRTQYISDAMIQSWAAYHVYGAFDLAAKAIAEFSRIQFETGEMSAVCPSDIFVHMPDYSLMWPVWLQRHYMYTGDRKFLTEMRPTLERLLDYYHQLTLGGRDDVLEDLHIRCGAYCFLDHGDIDREGVVTGLNAIYCRALLSGAWIFDQLGAGEKASELRRRMAATASQIRALTWDEERGLFADGWSRGRREMSQFYSWQTNVLAIYGGVARPEDYDGIFSRLFSDTEPYELFAAGDTNNPFFKYFVLESAFALDRRRWGMELIRWYWGRMLARGATTWWEIFDPEGREDEVPECSLCHGYGVSPNGFLISELVGIRPATPGFTTAYFSPILDVVASVKARIPTPYGHINVEWHRKDGSSFEAVIDANFPLDVIPVLDPGIAEIATIHVSDDVTILAQMDGADEAESVPEE